jgi:hypothetical protein
VDRDDGFEARIFVVSEHDLFVAEGIEGFENHQRLRLATALRIAYNANKVG